jgi:hypothetical protein
MVARDLSSWAMVLVGGGEVVERVGGRLARLKFLDHNPSFKRVSMGDFLTFDICILFVVGLF